MNQSLPPGYRSLVPLDRDRHGGYGVREPGRFGFARSLSAIQVTSVEFFRAARHYPIVFVRDPNAGAFMPLAVTALTTGANLFVDDRGEWLRHTYVPAYVRRFPFFTVRVAGADAPGKSVVCVEESALEADSDSPLFDAAGQATSVWSAYEKLIEDFEGARAPTDRLSKALVTLKLLEPFEAHAYPKLGQELRLRGLHRVSEKRLNALAAKDLRQLMKRGELSRIYAHLMSLDNFRDLLDRAGPTGRGGAVASSERER